MEHQTREAGLKELNGLPGTELLAAVRDGRASVMEIAESCLQWIEEREPVIQAFCHHDPDLVRRSAGELDHNNSRGRLRGLPVGVKDLIDTASHPTEFGSSIYLGRRPQRDAAVVTRLLAAGALMMGKTVTTEFALFHPGPTANPRDTTRTPGGSSSGSAAATADSMVAVSIGTQTAGSVIRPASFCGVVGFKPTFGAIDRTGVKIISPTLDTLGLLARNVADIVPVFDVVREARPDYEAGTRPAPTHRRLGFLRTAEWESADPATRHGLEDLASDLAGQDFDIVETILPADFEELIAAQVTVMESEVARSLQNEFREHGHLLSDSTRAMIERGAMRSVQEYDRAVDVTLRCRSSLGDVFDQLDGLLTLGVVGEAPTGLGFTGDPVFCRVWTLLHTPAISLPLLRGPHGLPVGAQLVGLPHADDALLQLASEIMGAASGPR